MRAAIDERAGFALAVAEEHERHPHERPRDRLRPELLAHRDDEPVPRQARDRGAHLRARRREQRLDGQELRAVVRRRDLFVRTILGIHGPEASPFFQPNASTKPENACEVGHGHFTNDARGGTKGGGTKGEGDMIGVVFMRRDNSKRILGISVLGISFALGGCGSDGSATISGGASSSSSSSASGTGGAGGAAGAGGMGAGGMGGMGGMGGAAGAGGMGAGGAGGGAACAKPMNNPCLACVFDSCNAAFCDCDAEPACPKIVPCVQQCPANDQGCRDNCYAVNSIGFAEFLGISNCAGTTCAASCPGAQPVGACELCLSQQCEQQFEACFGNPLCTMFIDCVRACAPGDMTCTMKCGTDFAGGVNQATQLRDCSQIGCANVCN